MSPCAESVFTDEFPTYAATVTTSAISTLPSQLASPFNVLLLVSGFVGSVGFTGSDCESA